MDKENLELFSYLLTQDLINSEKVLIYKGRYDDSPRNPMHATTSEMNDDLDQFLNGENISVGKTDSIGCSIKWIS